MADRNRSSSWSEPYCRHLQLVLSSTSRLTGDEEFVVVLQSIGFEGIGETNELAESGAPSLDPGIEDVDWTPVERGLDMVVPLFTIAGTITS